MMAAEQILRQCRSMVANMPQEMVDVVSLATGRLDVHMVRVVLKKPESKFKNIEAVGANFIDEIKKGMADKNLASQSTTPLVSPWAAQAADASSSGSQVGVANVMQYSADGVAVGPLQTALRAAACHKCIKQGFVEGSNVKDDDTNIFKIVKIDESGNVELAQYDNRGKIGMKTTVKHDDFVTTYSTTTATIEVIDKWEEKSMSKANESYNEELSKSYARLALRMIADDIGEPKNLRLQVKPHKGVFVDAAFAKDKLILVPETPTIVLRKDWPNNGLKIDSPIDIGDKMMFIMPTFNAKDAVVPSWLVRTVSEEKQANMVITKKSVSITMNVGQKKSEKSEKKVEIKVPVLVNSKKLDAQDELKIYRATPTTKKRGGLALSSFSKAPKLA